MAAAGFRTRRIKSDTSIGDRLKKARIRQKVSVTDVEEATKIRAKFILALESDAWEHIPSEVYGRGYLETYAAFLKLPVAEIMHDYDKMRSLYARRCSESTVDFAPSSSVRLPKVVLTPRAFVIGGLSLALLAFAGVIGHQVSQYTSAPYLQLVETVHAQTIDGSPELIVSTSTYTVKGQTAVGATVMVNGNSANVDGAGNFSYTLQVQKGVNAVVVEATNPNGKKTSEVISVVVK